MYKKTIWICLALIVGVFLFRNVLFQETNEKTGDLYVIDLVNPIRKTIRTSDFVEKIEYLKLETLDECLLGTGLEVRFTKKYILCYYWKAPAAYVFDKTTGKYLKTIARTGPGPGEYPPNYMLVSVDAERDVIYLDHWAQYWTGINLDTEEITHVQKPPFFITSFCRTDSGKFIGYVNNVSGSVKTRFVVFDSTGTTLRTFPNYEFFTRIEKNTGGVKETFSFLVGNRFKEYKKHLYIHPDYYHDTVFMVSCDAVRPHVHIKMGDKRPTYWSREAGLGIVNYYAVSVLGESDRYILFSCSYKGDLDFGYYDKKSGKTYLCSNDKVVNDMNMLENNMITTYVEAETIFEYMNANKNIPPEMEHLRDIKEDDNPVIQSITLKK